MKLSQKALRIAEALHPAPRVSPSGSHTHRYTQKLGGGFSYSKCPFYCTNCGYEPPSGTIVRVVVWRTNKPVRYKFEMVP